MTKIDAIILAGGQSKRFKSAIPKVLHPICGRAVIRHVLEALRELHRKHKLSRVCIVENPNRLVSHALKNHDFPFRIVYAVQSEPLGTGDAARSGLSKLPGAQRVLILAGDGPAIRPATLSALVKSKSRTTMVTAVLPDPGSYGRVLRDESGQVTGVIEAADLPKSRIHEVNASIYCFDAPSLRKSLRTLCPNNKKRELILTDVIGAATATITAQPDEVLGVNTRAEFDVVAQILRGRIIDSLTDAGVRFIHPETAFVDAGIQIGADTTILPMTHLEGRTKIGRGCEIGPDVRLVDTTVGDGSEVTFAVVRDSRIGRRCSVGPFASLRPGTVLKDGAKVGTFVETKNATVGENSKVPHLSYMGDVKIGKKSNVGAGSITCNYDPFKPGEGQTTKHRTQIGDDVSISSDTMLVAPVNIGNGARTGAGSVITRDVKSGELVYGVPGRVRKPSYRKKK